MENVKAGAATYSPEDNKLRLYIGRVPRDEYERLRAQGWQPLHKQREDGKGDFAATWTPERRDTALSYAETIDDEDAGPAERAADRAERFSGYRDKRTTEAGGMADRYEAGPTAHGYQSAERAERAAARHDRTGNKAVDLWGRAEYWHRRTAAVISHALHLSSPAVRMGRIKTIESELRKIQASRAEMLQKWRTWQKIAAKDEPERTAAATVFSGYGHSFHEYTHPITGRKGSLWSFVSEDAPDRITGEQAAALYFAAHTDPDSPAWNETRLADWENHLNQRLAYENQMLEAQGGRAAHVEIIPGGFLRGGRRLGDGERRIVKVNKSPATGRVVSVLVRDNHPSSVNHWGNPWPDGVPKVLSHTVETERLPADAYRPPTPEELAAFQAEQAAEKKARKAAAPPPIPLINPTDEEAERLQALWNERAKADHCARHLRAYGRDYSEQFKPSTVCRITQARYSEASKGSFARAETRGVCRGGELEPRSSNLYSARAEAEAKRRGPAICQVRNTSGDGSDYGARRVIVLIDKPQKPLPAAVWEVAPELVKA